MHFQGSLSMVCVRWDWCDDVVKSWSDDYKRISYVTVSLASQWSHGSCIVLACSHWVPKRRFGKVEHAFQSVFSTHFFKGESTGFFGRSSSFKRFVAQIRYSHPWKALPRDTPKCWFGIPMSSIVKCAFFSRRAVQPEANIKRRPVDYFITSSEPSM